jgi:hypothetical protein
MSEGGPRTEVTLPDPAPANGGPLRPALWHASALSCCGYRVAAHEFKHDASGQCWRTWHVSSLPIRPMADTVLASGSSQLMALYDSGQMVARWPGCAYLAAYHGARNLDIIRAYVERGGPAPVVVAVRGGTSPLAALVPSSARAEAVSLAEMIRGQHVSVILRDLHLVAALVTMGFPLDGASERGVRVLAHAEEGVDEGIREPQYGVAITCPDLPLGAAVAGYRAIRDQTRVAQETAVAGDKDPPLESPLEEGHLLHWAAAGALRREALRKVEAQLGHDASRLRSHILQGKSRRGGHAVIATEEEFQANESTIINHLRRFG